METRTLSVPKSTPATIAIGSSSLTGMQVHLPAQILTDSLMGGAGNSRQIGGDVVFKSSFTDVAQQALHPRNFDYTRTTERVQRIIRELTIAHIAANSPGAVIRRKPRVAHRPCFHASDAGPESVLFPYAPCDDFLEIHPYFPEKMLRQVTAVEANSLIG